MTSHRDGAYSTRLLVEDLEQLRHHLELPRIALLGISFGGDLAAEYTVAHPERVDRLILAHFPHAEEPHSYVAQIAAFLADDEALGTKSSLIVRADRPAARASA